MKKILFIDNGIEFDSRTMRSQPTGGAENAFVSLVETLAKRNFNITVFNNCKNTGIINGVNWKKISEEINDWEFDIIVVNRGDKYLNFRKQCKKRIFWIHNPAKYLLKFRYLKKLFFNSHNIVFSSQYHLKTYPNWAPFYKKTVIPYGVDSFFFDSKEKKSPPRPLAIFTSNAERGMSWLLDRWEQEIFPKVPNAKLNLFSGIESYGEFGEKQKKKVIPILARAESLKNKGVEVNKPIPRKKLVSELKKARVFVYQGSKEETFCMSVAEAQVLAIPTVVKDYGCMKERVIHKKTGYICKTNNEFSKSVIKLLTENNTWLNMHNEMIKNNTHLTWDDVSEIWEKIL